MIEHVDADRLRDLTLELVEVDSPTGDTAEVARLFARREMNLTTALERQRLAKTMPGQTGAMNAARLGFVA